MKSNIILFFCVLLLGISITSCDYIDIPYPKKIPEDSLCAIFSFTANPLAVKKVLVEDYTGFHCVNCPKAGDELTSILASYPDKVIGMGVHVGSFADPNHANSASAPVGSFTTDFRTSAGDKYDEIFKLSTNGGTLPIGMVNRKDFDNASGTHRKSFIKSPTWAEEVEALLVNPPDIDLQIHNDYNDVSKNLCTQIYARFLNPLSGTYKLVVLLMQDSIKNWQEDGSSIVENYWHRHVLRASINSSDGMGVKIPNSGSITQDLVVTAKWAYIIPADIKHIPCDPSKCHVVAFIYNATNLEILQVEEEKVK